MQRHKILFATDFGSDDQSAFLAACQLAHLSGWKLVVLHVQDPRHSAASKASRVDVDKEFTRYVPKDPEIKIEHCIETGSAFEEILAFSRNEEVGLVVLGTHGRNWVSRAFIGSVAEKIVRNTEVPVMTIHCEARIGAYPTHPKILVPVDFSACGQAAIEFAATLAGSIKGEVTIAHIDQGENAKLNVVSEDQADWTNHQRALWEKLLALKPTDGKIGYSHKLLSGEPGKAICDFAELKGFDLIVMGPMVGREFNAF